MKVMITTNSGEEWYALCQGVLGRQLEPEHTFIMATAPGVQQQACIYIVTDQLATWIELRHPRWVYKEQQ